MCTLEASALTSSNVHLLPRDAWSLHAAAGDDKGLHLLLYIYAAAPYGSAHGHTCGGTHGGGNGGKYIGFICGGTCSGTNGGSYMKEDGRAQ